jgi:hypothetical protein
VGCDTKWIELAQDRGDDQWELWRNRQITNWIFYTRKVLQIACGKGGRGEQRNSITEIYGLRKACNSVMRRAMHNNLTESGATIKLVRLIKM